MIFGCFNLARGLSIALDRYKSDLFDRPFDWPNLTLYSNSSPPQKRIANEGLGVCV